ncbi:hypothetical protein [Halorarius halobius]|uniref:hypothetical protein n=1 Tax=Halorarius halobius TaxID=2962671 RepID=UPI0020CE60B2|nr:hypothetical protein [Halorarius halobius]
MTDTVRTVGAALLLLLSVLAVAAVPVAGHGTGPEEVVNETVAVDNETQSVYLEVENTSANVTAHFYHVNGSNETLVTNATLSASGDNATDLYEFDEAAGLDAENYSEVKVVAHVPENETVERTEVGVIQKVSGGAGGIGGTGKSITTVGVLAVVAVGAILYKRD